MTKREKAMIFAKTPEDEHVNVEEEEADEASEEELSELDDEDDEP